MSPADRLSNMPEDIISNILSRMSTKHAVRTSALSKRWRYNWTYVTNLDFDDSLTHHVPTRRPPSQTQVVKSVTAFVNRVLTLCKTSEVNLFRLRFDRFPVRQSNVSKWINEGVKLNVKVLDIKVKNLALPSSVLTCKTLTTLRILNSSNDSYNWEFPCQVDLPCLKTLDIAVYYEPSVSAFKLISGCPMLENLYLDVSYCVEGVVYQFNIPTLKRLEVSWNSEKFINNVVLNVPNLEYLSVSGSLCMIFVMENVSSLVEASISLSHIQSYHVWVELLKGLSGVKSLTVQFPGLFIDFKTLFASPLPVFPNMKHFELKDVWCIGLSLYFLESSPKLKHLCIVREDVSSYKKEKAKKYTWVEPKLVPACMLTELITIKFSACEWWECELPFLKYMLGNAKVLKTVTINWEELLKFPTVSSCCEIHFNGKLLLEGRDLKGRKRKELCDGSTSSEILHEAEMDDGGEENKNEEETVQEVVEMVAQALDDVGKEVDDALRRFGNNEKLQRIKQTLDLFRGV